MIVMGEKKNPHARQVPFPKGSPGNGTWLAGTTLSRTKNDSMESILLVSHVNIFVRGIFQCAVNWRSVKLYGTPVSYLVSSLHKSQLRNIYVRSMGFHWRHTNTYNQFGPEWNNDVTKDNITSLSTSISMIHEKQLVSTSCLLYNNNIFAWLFMIKMRPMWVHQSIQLTASSG